MDQKEQRGAYETEDGRQDTASLRPNSTGHETPDLSRSSGGSTEPPESKGERPYIDLNVLFDVLKNRRRRRVLEFLDEQESQTTLSVVAEYLAAIENDKPRELLTSQERKRVYIGLYQFHLPRMDRAGVVEFDRNRGTIEACEELTAYRSYVGGSRRHSTSPTAPALLTSTSVLSGSALTAALVLMDVPGWITNGVLLVALSIVTLLASTSIVLNRGLAVDRQLTGSSLR